MFWRRLELPFEPAAVTIQQLPASAGGFYNRCTGRVGPAACVDQEEAVALLERSSMDMAADDAIHSCFARGFQLAVVKAIDQVASVPRTQCQCTWTRKLEIPTQMVLFQAMKEANAELFAAVERDRLVFELIAVGDQ